MKKQRKRIYTALLCTCFLLSTASVPVSAAETEQEEMTTLSNRSGEAKVSAKDELTSALEDSNISKITLEKDIDISDALTVNRAVTLDLSGFVLRMTGEDSVIKVGQGTKRRRRVCRARRKAEYDRGQHCRLSGKVWWWCVS